MHVPVIFSPIQFLCSLFLEERCVQVQALQLCSEGSQVPGLCQQHSSRVPRKIYSTSLQPNHSLSTLCSVLFPSLNRVRSQNRAHRTPTSALTVLYQKPIERTLPALHTHIKNKALPQLASGKMTVLHILQNASYLAKSQMLLKISFNWGTHPML